jgi:hypothetical protein
MPITPEELQEYRLEITNSDLSQGAKDQALRILSMPDVGPESLDAIADLIQKDIDADLDSIEGLKEAVEQDPGYQELMTESERQVKKIEDDLQESVNFIESEGAKLDELAAQLDQASAEARLEEVKQNLKDNQA